METLLEVRDLHAAHGKVRALQGASIDVGEGEIVSLIGANGAGKSTLLHSICGMVPPLGGTVRYRGRRIDGLSSHRILHQGIALVPEGRLIFSELTIRENLEIGALAGPFARSPGPHLGGILELFPMLGGRLGAQSSGLSGGEQQMLALARGLMAAPDLLLLDELTLGLSPRADDDVFSVIRDLRERGVAILLVEQNVCQALSVADRGYVLEAGRIVLEGPAAMLSTHDLLVQSYMGVTMEEIAR